MLTGNRLPRAAALLLVPLLTALGTACGGERPDPGGGVVRVAIGEPHHLLPTNVDDPDGAQVVAALFTPLVDFDAAGRPRPAAASAIEAGENSRVWTVRLREGFTFHDGEPVTADNYLAAWNYGAYQPNAQRNNHLFARIAGYQDLNPPAAAEPPTTQSLSGLEVVDELTFTVTLAEPFADFRSMLGAVAFHPLPSSAFEAPGVLRADFETAPVGNGPFRIVGQWERGQRIVLERYEEYAGDTPRISGVEFRVYDDLAFAYPDLLTGEVQLLPRIPAAHLPSAADQLGDRYLRDVAPVFQYLAAPSYQDTLASPAIRHAISMAIDRDEIVDAVLHGSQLPARGFVAPLVPGAGEDTCGRSCELDPTAARDLYESNGGPRELTITYNADGGHTGWVEATCRQLSAHLSVECTGVAEPDLPTLLARVANQEEVGLVRLSWVVDYPSMAAYLGPVFSTNGSMNFSGYQNPVFDELLAIGSAAATEEEAIAAYRQAESLLAEDLPVIPLRFGAHHVGHAPEIRDIAISRLGHIDINGLALVP